MVMKLVQAAAVLLYAATVLAVPLGPRQNALKFASESDATVKASQALITQQIVFSASTWHSFAFTVQPANTSLSAVFSSAILSQGDRIEIYGGGGFSDYYHGWGWYPELTMDVTKAFKMRLSAAQTIDVTGPPVDLSSSRTLVVGWNFIPYSKQSSMNITAGLPTPITLSATSPYDQIKSLNEGTFAQYFGPQWGWYGTLTDLVPGYAYKLKLHAAQNGTASFAPPTPAAPVTRKEVHSLTDDEQDRFVASLRKMMEGGETSPFAEMAHLHGYPSHHSMGFHSNENFAYWHRVYLLEFEARLRNAHAELYGGDRNIGLPYWGWDKSTAPALDTILPERMRAALADIASAASVRELLGAGASTAHATGPGACRRPPLACMRPPHLHAPSACHSAGWERWLGLAACTRAALPASTPCLDCLLMTSRLPLDDLLMTS